jgi:LysR family nod box-dependent transcriptional activator
MNPGQLDLNLLKALDALLEEQHVTRAAERCGLSEPAMSRSLTRLRHLFGDELLVRVGREYYLTPFSADLARSVHEIVQNIDSTLARRPTFDPAADRRQFTIAASDYSAFLLMRSLTARVTASAPHVSLRVRPLTTGTFSELEHGHLDFAFRRQGLEPTLPSECLLTDRWVCAVWAQHPEVGEEIGLEQYVSLPHLSYSLGSDVASEWPVTEMSRSHDNAVTIESYVMLPFLLAQTRLIALLPERIGFALGDYAEVRLLEPPFPLQPIQLAMYWHPRGNNDPGHEWLRHEVRASCTELGLMA